MEFRFESEQEMEEFIVSDLEGSLHGGELKLNFPKKINNSSIILNQVGLDSYGIADIVILSPEYNSQRALSSLSVQLIELKNRALEPRDIEQIGRYFKGLKVFFEEFYSNIEISITPLLIGIGEHKITFSSYFITNLYIAEIEFSPIDGISLSYDSNFISDGSCWRKINTDFSDIELLQYMVGLEKEE